MIVEVALGLHNSGEGSKSQILGALSAKGRKDSPAGKKKKTHRLPIEKPAVKEQKKAVSLVFSKEA